MEKRVLTKYNKLPLEVKKALKNEYPMGFNQVLTTIKISSSGESTSALVYKYNDVLYLIKYTPKKRKDILEESEDDDETDNNSEPDNELNISIGGESYDDNN
jgi:hypothetical protein